MGNIFLNFGYNTATQGGSNNDREHIFNVLYYYTKTYQINTYGNKSKLSKINERKGNSLYLLHPITHHHHHSLLQHVNDLVYISFHTILQDHKLYGNTYAHAHTHTHTHIHAHMHTSLPSFFCFLLFVLKNWDYTIYTTLQLNSMYQWYLSR